MYLDELVVPASKQEQTIKVKVGFGRLRVLRSFAELDQGSRLCAAAAAGGGNCARISLTSASEI
jgi:hypothetical protein